MIDRTKVSFSEAEGRFRFPSILKWGEVDQRLRAALWTPFFSLLRSHIEYGSGQGYVVTNPVGNILLREFLERRNGFISDYRPARPREELHTNEWADFFKNADYVELFDFITFFLRDKDCPARLVSLIEKTLEAPYSPYRLSSETPTIVPVLTEEHAQTITTDIAQVFASPFSGAKLHMQASLDSLGDLLPNLPSFIRRVCSSFAPAWGVLRTRLV